MAAASPFKSHPGFLASINVVLYYAITVPELLLGSWEPQKPGAQGRSPIPRMRLLALRERGALLYLPEADASILGGGERVRGACGQLGRPGKA